MIKTIFFITLSFFIGAAYANSNNVMDTAITVKNMTDSSVIVDSATMNGFNENPNIQINGMSLQTPIETISAQSMNTFFISDKGMDSVVTGGIQLCAAYSNACGTFPMWAGGNGQDHTVWIDAPLTATSNNQYIVGAYEIDENHAVLDIYPAFKK